MLPSRRFSLLVMQGSTATRTHVEAHSLMAVPKRKDIPPPHLHLLACWANLLNAS